MKRLLVKYLNPGNTVSEPLHDQDGKLLLEAGKELTREMFDALLQSGRPFLYSGEWDQATFDRISKIVPLSDYRSTADNMIDALRKKLELSAAVVDLEPEPDGPEYEGHINRELKQNRSIDEVDACSEALDKGTETFGEISNGLIPPDEVHEAVGGVINNLMELFANDASLLNNLTSLNHGVEYVSVHAVNTAVLSINIATAMGYCDWQVREIGIGAMLHNIGMCMVPESVVMADRKLDSSEHIDIQKHIGYNLVLFEKFRGLPQSARLIMYQNKERADGTGYPRRLKRYVIHRFARIVAVADVYDAMITERPWRPAVHPYLAMEYLLTNARSKFDPEVVKGLLRYLSLFPIGSFVELNSGELARVIHSNEDDFYNPIVSILRNGNDEIIKPPQVRDLQTDENTKIKQVVEEVPDLDDLAGFVY